jgi:hypothetical protein
MSIESELKDLTDSFEKSSSELFSITGRFIKTFELGVYGCALAKPTKRMKKSLGVDREIFVVISNFKDQQQRTIRFLKAEIEASAGRYEPGIAFVVHMDPDGNSKLKNWGRDHSISILSIHNPAVFSNSSELEKYLCQELYSHDPFDVSGPVSDDGNFFGRRDEALDLAKKLQKGQIRSCLGIRKIGKTSIINRIVNEIKTNQQCVCIMIDCSKDDVWSLSASQLLASISESIKLANNFPQRYSKIQAINTEIAIGNARNSLEVEILASESPVVLIFDEIDYVTPGSPTNIEWKQEFNIFWRNLRSIYQETLRQHKVLSMLIGGVSTHWFTVESIDGIENAALSFVPEEYLSPLQEGASVAMIKRLGKISGLEFADDAAIHIARETANMPSWTRKCCSYIHKHIPINGRPSDVNINLANGLVKKFVDEEGVVVSEVALNHLFRVHPDLKNATMKCHHDKSSEVREHLKRMLKKYGVIS